MGAKDDVAVVIEHFCLENYILKIKKNFINIFKKIIYLYNFIINLFSFFIYLKHCKADEIKVILFS